MPSDVTRSPPVVVSVCELVLLEDEVVEEVELVVVVTGHKLESRSPQTAVILVALCHHP